MAAISSKIAADVHSLDILARGIEDRNDNTTRFLILCKGEKSMNHYHGPNASGFEMERWKTFIAFTIDHESPGALADALLVFKNHGLNLTSIDSRPSGVASWHYIFMVEFGGRKDGNGSGSVNEALGELAGVVRYYRYYGSWRNTRGR